MVAEFVRTLERFARRAVRPLDLRVHAARRRPRARSSTRSTLLEQRGTTPTLRRRALAAHDRVRRRQGPRAVRSSGEHTYFASDIAYHQAQARARLRPPDRHLGRRPPRLPAADASRLRGARRRPGHARDADHAARAPDAAPGERAQMSKRAGRVRDARRAVDEIGVDAARWYLLARSHDTTVDLDVELARSAVQREPGLLRAVRARADRVDAVQGRGASASRRPPRRSPSHPEPLHESERSLIELLLAFPAELAEAVDRRAPHRVAPTRSSWRRASRRSTATAASLGAEPAEVRGPADRPVPGEHAHDRALPRPARDQRAAGDVGRRSRAQSNRARSTRAWPRPRGSARCGPPGAAAAARRRQLGSRNASRRGQPSTATAGTR